MHERRNARDVLVAEAAEVQKGNLGKAGCHAKVQEDPMQSKSASNESGARATMHIQKY